VFNLHHTITGNLTVNVDRTLCYHFATQLGSTRQYGQRQAEAFGSISADESTLLDIEQNAFGRPKPHYECVALPAELPRHFNDLG
jgi:hypothetical protein